MTMNKMENFVAFMSEYHSHVDMHHVFNEWDTLNRFGKVYFKLIHPFHFVATHLFFALVSPIAIPFMYGREVIKLHLEKNGIDTTIL